MAVPKLTKRFVVVRQESGAPGSPGSIPNYYVGEFKVYDDGDVDEVVILACVGCLESKGEMEGSRIFACNMVDVANKQDVAHPTTASQMKKACEKYVESWHDLNKPVNKKARLSEMESEVSTSPGRITNPEPKKHRSAAPADGATDINEAIQHEMKELSGEEGVL